MNEPSTPLLVALQLASAGHRVFPCDCETRKPLVKWGSDATPDPVVLAEWWAQWPDAMPAIALPRDLLVFDMDPRNGGDVSMRALPDDALPDSSCVSTARGGLHIYYRVPEGHSIKNVTNLRPGIDVKTFGGFVIAPGAIRSDGLEYSIVNGCEPAPAPGWLLHECRRGENESTTGEPSTLTASPAGEGTEGAMTPVIVALLAPKLGQGGPGSGAHETALAIGGALTREGWSEEAVAALVRALPSTEPEARVRDALDARARVLAGDRAFGFSRLTELGFDPGVVSLVRDAATGGTWRALAEAAQARAVAAVMPTDGLERACTEDELEEALTRPVNAKGYRLGFAGLDDLIEDGVTAGDTIVLGGEGDAGKTQFQLQIENNLRSQGVAVVHVAADEERERVVLRQAQTLLDLRRGDLAEPSFDAGKIRLKADVRTKLRALRAGWAPIVYIDDPLLDQTAERAVLDFKARGFEVALCIDSGQTVSVSNAPIDRRAQVDAVIARWRAICRSAGSACIGVLTSETGRGFYKGAKQRPDNLMAAFKESGSIEYAARFAVVLEPGDDESTIVAHVVKNKLGGRKGVAEFQRTPGFLRVIDSKKPRKPQHEVEAEKMAATRAAILNLIASGFVTPSKQAQSAVERSLPNMPREDIRVAWQHMLNRKEIDRDSAGRWFVYEVTK